MKYLRYKYFLNPCILLIVIVAFVASAFGKESIKNEWLGNKFGITDDVPEPWTKIIVNKSRVNICGREYIFGDNGLLLGISVGGMQLLHSPIEIKIVANAQRVDTGTGYFRQELVKGNKAIFKSINDVASFNIETTAQIEYDGLVLFNFKVKPVKEPVVIDLLQIEIPLKKELVTLFTHHFIKNENQYKINSENDFGGGILPKNSWESPFTPLVWLGNENMGLQWFSESTTGWNIKNEEKTIAIRHKGNAVVLLVTVIDRDTKIDNELNVRFGLIATPVKPLPSYEKYSEFNTAQAASAQQALKWVKSDGNTTLLEKAVEKGLKMIVIHQMWTELQGYPGTFRKENSDALKKFIKEAHKRGLKVILYIGREISQSSPEWSSFGEKMIMKPNKAGKNRDDPPAKAFRPDANKYYSDFLVYKIKELIDTYDIDGVMLDGHGNIQPCENQMHGHGYVDSKGKIHPTYPIVETRDLLRRIYHLFHGGVKKNGIVLAHVGSPFVPSLAFSDFRWAGEGVLRKFKAGYWRGKQKPQSMLTIDEFRASYMNFQYGVPTIYMTKTGEIPVPVDETASITLIHDVMPRFAWTDLNGKHRDADDRLWRVWKMRRDFLSSGNPVFFPYWSKQDSVRFSQDDELKISFFKKEKGGILLFVTNLGRKDKTVNFYFDFKKGTRIRYQTTSGEKRISDTGVIEIPVKQKTYEVILIENVSSK
jgi:hypothetical protein